MGNGRGKTHCGAKCDFCTKLLTKANITDDQQLLQQGRVLYDALYTWAQQLQGQPHTQQPEEQLLVQV